MTPVGRDDSARRPQGKAPALTKEIPKTGGRGKPLPYGMAGETSLGGERAGLLTRPPVLLRRD